MLKRFSSTFKKKKGEANGHTNGTSANGAKATNGADIANGGNGVNGTSKPAQGKRMSFKKQQSETVDRSVTRGDVDTSFEQFAQLIHASSRPLPTQTGDGSYIEHEAPSSLFQDLKSLGFKDMKTLKDVLANKASGALADDKTMIMERVIQVSHQQK